MNVGGAISKNSKKLSLYISITKLIMITTSQKLLKTRNYFKTGRYLGKAGDREIKT